MNIDKMKKLLALTASDQEEEARTAAFMLCKMLREANADLSRLTAPQTLYQRMQADQWPKSDARRERERRDQAHERRKAAYQKHAAQQRAAQWREKREKTRQSWSEWAESF